MTAVWVCNASRPLQNLGKEMHMEDKTPQNEKKSNDSLHPKVVGRATVVLGLAVLLFSVLFVF